MTTHPRHIVLIGFSGSGKTTVARLLAKRLTMRFIDIDVEIEREFRSDIASIFEKQGEKRFRDLEYRTIKRIFSKTRRRAVISLGGGAFVPQRNREVIQSSSMVIWLSCSAREIYRRLKSDKSRPLLSVKASKGITVRQATMKRIAILLSKRKQSFSLADIRISTSKRSPSAVVNEVIGRLREFDVAS